MEQPNKRYARLKLGTANTTQQPDRPVESPENAEDDVWRFSRRSDRIASPASHALLFTMIGTIVAFVLWAAVFELDKVTRGDGRVVPYHEKQVMQHLEGGIITDITIREGSIVRAGDVLLRVDNQFARAELANTLIDLAAKRARLIRLTAESDGATSVAFPDFLQKNHRVALRNL